MGSDLTVAAVRMALGLSQTRAEVAGWNVVNASVPGSSFFVVDTSAVESALKVAASSDPVAGRHALATAAATGSVFIDERFDVAKPGLDEFVTDSVAAGLQYQLLGESLGRHFGLMRLAVSGRSGA